MTEAEIQRYLANIIAVLRADNLMSPKEEESLEEIRILLKARKKDVSKAQELASGSDFSIKPVGRYSDKIRNLEDMVLVALSDGNLPELEKELIRKFARELELAQSQMNLIIREAKDRVQKLTVTTTCAACLKSIPANAKFCPECGQTLIIVEEVIPRSEFDYPQEGISIEFAQSSAANFHEALAAAQSASDFQEIERQKKKWYLASWNKDQIRETLSLVDALQRLKNRKVYVNGKLESWDDVFAFLWCYQNRDDAYKPIEYCFSIHEHGLNLWGCRLAYLDWHGWRCSWLSYGAFLNKDLFVFDKKRIRHELERNLYKVRFCPVLRLDFVETVLKLIPERVRIGDQFGWTYNRAISEDSSAIQVTETVTADGYTYTTTFRADGVRPVGVMIAEEILTEALQRCAMSHVNFQNLREA